MTEMIYKDLAHDLLNPLYCGERIGYEAEKLETGKTEKLVMIALADGEKMYPSVLCRQVHASSPRMAVILNKLESRGWITRTPEAADSRKTRIQATEEGKKAAGKCIAALEEQMGNALALMGEEDAREYVRLQTKLSTLLKKTAQKDVW